jgi:nitrate/nitrite transport system substrate-binding protein
MDESKHHAVKRRDFIKGSAQATGLLLASSMVPAGLRSQLWAAGSDKPELTDLNVGFIPLTDCAPVVMASLKGFDKKYGITIKPSKEASWAGVRDKLANGELHASHVLYGMLYGMQLGINGPMKKMAVLMNLNQNGQAITLAESLKKKGVTDGTSLAKLIKAEPKEYTFANTYPTGTHAMWIYYWLAQHGVHPMKDVKNIVVPPPQMVANMRVGNMDGFCVGEPWNARALADGIGFTAVTTQEIWPDHPEKVLGTTQDFVKKYPNTARCLTAAVMEASRYIDDKANRMEVAKILAAKSYVNAPEAVMIPRFMGSYENGLGRKWEDPHKMKFYDEGKASFPYLSDGMWFLTQYKRWGLVKSHPDYLALAQEINQIGIYKEAAALTKTAVPSNPLRSSTLMDGKVWDGSKPGVYADSFAIKDMS